MLKLIAIALLFFACGLTGAFLTRAMQVRVRELECILQMLTALRTQMQFSRAPLEAMLTQVCAQERHPQFLPHCLAQMQAGTPFPVAWKHAAQQAAGVKDEDRQLLFSVGELLGSTDASGQREGLQLHEELAAQLLETARAKKESHGKTYFSLGVLSGLTLVILLS